ncbi:hypothetical protein RNJ44_01532 [Nakaseomyces bracarensis]|uniref:Inheritance of peroxisomes protein 2 n=1 Tax=Nakaseomyces bracarensis TaxID=273131 RepID=A0ABR4NQ00_9SACH
MEVEVPFNVLSNWRGRVMNKYADPVPKHVVFEDDLNSKGEKDSCVVPDQSKWQNKVRKNNWNEEIVNKVFHSVSWVSDEQFLEELRYTLITSPLLNDFTPRQLSYSISNSIMDFHKNGVRHNLLEKTLITKLGSLKVYTVNKNFELRQTVDFLRTHRNAYSLLKYLLGQNKYARRKIVTVILITLYLGYEQSHFHSQYKKFSLLIQLQNMVKKSQRFDTLLKKFYNKHLDVRDQNEKLEPILFSVGTLTVIKYFQFAEYLISFTNMEQLSKYCGIYGIQINALYALKNPQGHGGGLIRIDEIISQTEVLRKFILCCFLSLRCGVDCEPYTMKGFAIALDKIFPKADIINPDRSSEWRSLVAVTKKFNQDTDNLFCSLNEQKELLYWVEDEELEAVEARRDSLSTIDPYHSKYGNNNGTVNEVLYHLQVLEQNLLSLPNEVPEKEIQALLSNHVHQIRHVITKNLRTRSKYNIFSNSGNSRSSMSGKGLFLDVLKSPIENQVSNFEQMGVLKPVITTISDNDELESILSINNEERFTEDANDHHTYEYSGISPKIFSQKATMREFDVYDESQFDEGNWTPTHVAGSSLEKLSDDQLRNKLNEKIRVFATENKKNRERLRTKKSLELLRGSSDPLPLVDRTNRENSYSDMQGMLKRETVTNRKRKDKRLYSEETIPLFYELSEMISNKS